MSKNDNIEINFGADKECRDREIHTLREKHSTLFVTAQLWKHIC